MARRTDGKKRGKRERKKLNSRESHGLYAAQRFVSEYGYRALDQRTAVAKELTNWKAQLLEDLGGLENVSTARLELVNLAGTTRLLLSGLDIWLANRVAREGPEAVAAVALKAPSILKARGGMVRELHRLLSEIGLEKREPEGHDLTHYIEQRYGGRDGKGDGKREDNA